jgi:GNAT superfamily N-acetyltransferase
MDYLAPDIEVAGGFTLKFMATDPFNALTQTHMQALFDDERPVLRLRNHLSPEQKSTSRGLAARMGDPYKLNLAAFHGDQLAGWSLGVQESGWTFYMQNSAVLPEYRRRGLYTAMMSHVVATATKLGFQEIYSCHLANNNHVLIPKLKAGFAITSFEISDVFGILVHLTHHTVPLRRKALDYRISAYPDAEITKAFALDRPEQS